MSSLRNYFSKKLFTDVLLTEHRKIILDRVLFALNCKKNGLAQYLKISPQSVTNIKNRKIPIEWLKKVCLEKKISLIWLLTGDGSPYQDDELDESFEYLVETIARIMMLPKAMPLVPTKICLASKSKTLKSKIIQCGAGEIDHQEMLQKIPIVNWNKVVSLWKGKSFDSIDYAKDFIVIEKRIDSSSFCLNVINDSMKPEFAEGDIILINPIEEVRSGDFVIAKTGESAAFRKYIEDSGQVYLKPLNSEYDQIKALRKNVIGKVIRKIKDY